MSKNVIFQLFLVEIYHKPKVTLLFMMYLIIYVMIHV